MKAKKKLIVIGDRVLMELDESRESATHDRTSICRPPLKKGKRSRVGYIVRSARVIL